MTPFSETYKAAVIICLAVSQTQAYDVRLYGAISVDFWHVFAGTCYTYPWAVGWPDCVDLMLYLFYCDIICVYLMTMSVVVFTLSSVKLS